MAYMNQQKKGVISSALKPVLKKYGVKGTLSVNNHTGVILKIKSGKIDFFSNFNRIATENNRKGFAKITPLDNSWHCDVNPYWFHEHYDGEAKMFLEEAFDALKSADWFDKSDAMIDYFNTAYYYYLQIGSWNKPYEVTV